jgi:hypothetical protein
VSGQIGLIERGWRSYRDQVLPNGAPPIQLQETRRAFYAGAKALLTVLTNDVTPLTEDAGVRVLETIDKVLNQFRDDVLGGRK